MSRAGGDGDVQSLWSTASSPGRLEAWMREQQWAGELLGEPGGLILQGPQAMLMSQFLFGAVEKRIDSGTGGGGGGGKSNLY